ncbi:MAG: aldo/keto reductase, partial [Oscillospiraceae bacterium]
ASIMPMVNQLKLCPGETQSEITSFCKDRGIIVEAYSPLGTGKALLNPSILEMAEKYGKSAAQICIRWSLQMGYLPLPKSLDIDREKSNTEVFDFNIEKQDIEKLSSLVGCGGETKDPDKVPF